MCLYHTIYFVHYFCCFTGCKTSSHICELMNYSYSIYGLLNCTCFILQSFLTLVTLLMASITAVTLGLSSKLGASEVGLILSIASTVRACSLNRSMSRMSPGEHAKNGDRDAWSH